MLRNKTTLIVLCIGAFLLLFGIAAAILIPRTAPENGGQATGNNDFLPFGEDSGERDLSGLFPDDSGDSEILPPNTGGQPVLQQADLRQLTSVPVVGGWAYSVIEVEDIKIEEPHTFVRYIDRSTGHIYEMDLDGVDMPRKLTQVTVPRLQEALWASTGSSILMRYFNENAERIRTFAADIVPVEATEDASPEPKMTFNGAFLREDIISLSYSPDGRSIFFLVAPNGGARGFLARTDGEELREVFRSPLRELRTAWPTPNQILITTKASSEASGFAFSVNPQSGFANPILTNQTALTAKMSPDGARVVFFSRDGGSPLLRVLSTSDGSVRRMPLVTLPDDKCVWSDKDPIYLYCAVPKIIPTGLYPDVWYRGEAFYEDILWRINTETAATDLLVAPVSAGTGEGVDAVDLFLDDEERYLFFRNKRDGTLWSIKVEKLFEEAFPTES